VQAASALKKRPNPAQGRQGQTGKTRITVRVVTKAYGRFDLKKDRRFE